VHNTLFRTNTKRAILNSEKSKDDNKGKAGHFLIVFCFVRNRKRLNYEQM